MTVGEMVSIVSASLTIITVIIGILSFRRATKKDSQEKEKKDVEFYTTTALTLGGLKENVAELKTELLRRQDKDEFIEKRLSDIESRVSRLEGLIKGRH